MTDAEELFGEIYQLLGNLEFPDKEKWLGNVQARKILHKGLLPVGDMGWQPIETAPRDGTEFQAWLKGKYNPEGFWDPRCRYNEDGAFEIWGRVAYDYEGWDVYHDFVPTHWMPVPQPPKEGK